MTNIVVVLNEDGTFDSLLTDSEIDARVLRKGQDDAAIETAEECYTNPLES
jgi:hypothetical protein